MTYYRSGKIVITCAEPMPTQVDGDPSGEATTVTVRVAPRSLLLRVKEDAVRENALTSGGTGSQAEIR
jgi:diacylglycerol kinase family enzyme